MVFGTFLTKSVSNLKKQTDNSPATVFHLCQLFVIAKEKKITMNTEQKSDFHITTEMVVLCLQLQSRLVKVFCLCFATKNSLPRFPSIKGFRASQNKGDEVSALMLYYNTDTLYRKPPMN